MDTRWLVRGHQLIVPSSSGNGSYVVRDGVCPCEGFKYRGRCKHVDTFNRASELLLVPRKAELELEFVSSVL